jgi:general secretion pathway protein A
MYTRYFGLAEEPFSIAANPRFLYMSAGHREALAHLLYGIRHDSGFVLLTGQVGTGKTTVCRCLLEQLPDNTDVVFILNPKMSVLELLDSICDELGIGDQRLPSSVKAHVDAINHCLLNRHGAGRNTVIIIDEAQNLSMDVLEQLRLLTNLETNERKLMRIILLGQPELEDMLARPELKQLEQRITARYRLQPLRRSEIGAYIKHRLTVAGCREPVFSAPILAKVYRKTHGIPRLINIICDRAMLGAYAKSKRRISRPILDRAAQEVQGKSRGSSRPLGGMIAAFVLLAGVTAVATLYYINDGDVFAMVPKRWANAATNHTTGIIATPATADSERHPEKAKATTIQVSEVDLPVPEPSVPSWPTQINTDEETHAAAFAILFREWKLSPALDDLDPCTQARESRLYCFSGVGNLGSLIAYDRPAILTLFDNGQRYKVVLLHLREDRATLAFAHGVETVAVKDLEVRWRGQFELLWRGSPYGSTLIAPGSRGRNVTWLTQTLIDEGVTGLQAKNVYDDAVTVGVKAFQRAQGLEADGIVGRQTLNRLNSVSDKSIPRLAAREIG